MCAVLVVCLFPYIPASPHLLMAQSAADKAAAALALGGHKPGAGSRIESGLQPEREHVCAATRLMQRAAQLAGKQLPPGTMVPDASDAVSSESDDEEGHACSTPAAQSGSSQNMLGTEHEPLLARSGSQSSSRAASVDGGNQPTYLGPLPAARGRTRK